MRTYSQGDSARLCWWWIVPELSPHSPPPPPSYFKPFHIVYSVQCLNDDYYILHTTQSLWLRLVNQFTRLLQRQDEGLQQQWRDWLHCFEELQTLLLLPTVVNLWLNLSLSYDRRNGYVFTCCFVFIATCFFSHCPSSSDGARSTADGANRFLLGKTPFLSFFFLNFSNEF